MDRANRFFDSLRLAEARDEVLVPFADDPDGYEAASDADPAAVEAFIREAGKRGTGTVAEIDRHAFASAAADADGQIVFADSKFAGWLTNSDLSERIVGRASGDRPRVIIVASSVSGRPVAVASARGATVRNWPLDKDVLRALETGRASHALLAFTPRVDTWGTVAETFALTPSEARLLAALARVGDLRNASASVEITYETGRKLIASVMRKTGSARQTELVRLALQLAAGSVVAPASAGAIFAELFGLTVGRARVVRRVADGETREQAANALRISPARAKADLKAVYVACDVTTAVDLSRLVAEVDALAGLAEACDIELFGTEIRDEPLRLLRRRNRRGRVAFADHGPEDKYPVLIFHTTTGGRAQSPQLLATLGQNGFRPIVIERPGYGLTDIADGHCWADTAADVRDVLDELDIDNAVLLARGGAQPAVATAAALLDRIAGVVLIGPDPPVHLDRSRRGMMGRAKAMIYNNPKMLDALSLLLSQRTSSVAIERMMRSSVQGSEIDLAVCDDRDEMVALVRGGRQSAQGRVGFVAEHAALSRGDALPVIQDASNWTILFGAGDPLFAPEDAQDYWRGQLPGCRFDVVNGGGRFLHVTHTSAVIEALSRAKRDGVSAVASKVIGNPHFD